jgi:hypothetical protein
MLEVLTCMLHLFIVVATTSVFQLKVKPSPPAAFEINNAEVLNCMLICLMLNPLPLFFS